MSNMSPALHTGYTRPVFDAIEAENENIGRAKNGLPSGERPAKANFDSKAGA
jgi:hypothetical protein